MPRLTDPVGNFWRRVAPPDQRGCRLWSGATNGGGYGILRFDRRPWLAHRLAWALIHGPIPDGLDVLHSCDIPSCCADEHLRPGTDIDNHADQMRRGRHQFAFRDRCSHGHEFTPENTYVRRRARRSYRACRTCAADYQRRYRERKAERA